jgi:hypothetical protein
LDFCEIKLVIVCCCSASTEAEISESLETGETELTVEFVTFIIETEVGVGLTSIDGTF